MSSIASRVSIFAAAVLLAAPAHSSAQQIFELKDLTGAPSIKSATQAQRVISRSYPRNLQSAGVGGTVQLRFVVAADGSVTAGSIEVLASSSQALAEAATSAIGEIEFNPGTKDGSAVSSYVVMPIRYAAQ